MNTELIKYFANKGWYVIALGENPDLEEMDNVEIYNLSFGGDRTIVKRILKGYDCDLFIHTAFSVDGDLDSVVTSDDIKRSAELDSWLFSYLASLRIPHVISIGTTFVYGVPENRATFIETSDTFAYNNYAALKLNTETAMRVALAQAEKPVTKFASIRTAALYSPDYLDNVLPYVFNPKDRCYFVYGGGNYALPLCHIKNFCELIYCYQSIDNHSSFVDTHDSIAIFNACDQQQPLAFEVIDFLKENYRLSPILKRSSPALKKVADRLLGAGTQKRDVRHVDADIFSTTIRISCAKACSFTPMRHTFPATEPPH